jgi:hypothetical protein
MPQVGFEPKIPVFERVKTFHASARAVSVIDLRDSSMLESSGVPHNRALVSDEIELE